MKLDEMHSHEEVLARSLDNPDFRREWERTALARAVAMRVVAYRVTHRLTQTELARRLGLKQPAVARLEAGDHEPSLATLMRLSRTLGMEFHIDITPDRFDISA